MKNKYVKIEGIHCNHCIDVITNELLKNKKSKTVKIKNDIAIITYKGNLTKEEIISTIKNIDYFTKEEYISDNINELDNKIKLKEFILIVVIILVIWFLINKLFGYNIFNVIPSIDSNITYSMLFLTGLLTSIHCISMCGAINLIAVVDSNNKNYKKPILYNLGRVISYTLIGGIVGLVGKVISLNNILNGTIILCASIIMLLMSLNMLGILKFKLPVIYKLKINKNQKNSFIIGLLNGLMPCGPLQAMQLYALSTGSFIKGALSMFLFSLGTVPLMLFVGIFYNFIKGKGKIIINKIASVLIMILSLVMLKRGLLTLGIDVTKIFNDYRNYTSSTIVEDYQIVEFDLDYNNYADIIVQKDIPVKMIIHVDNRHLTVCNNKVILNDFNVSKDLREGDNIIEFMPSTVGTFPYTCSMNMIKNNIKVIDDISYFEVKE